VTTRLDIYRCKVCGNVVEVLHGGKGALTCCNEPMKKFEANTVDAAREKHVPIVDTTGEGVIVKVGSTPHPMEEKHYIEWIEVDKEKNMCREFLTPGDVPEALFPLSTGGMTVRAYCNVHGLWEAKQAG